MSMRTAMRRVRAVLVPVLALTLSLSVPVAASESTVSEPSSSTSTGQGGRWITLLTGDRVLVLGRGKHAVEPGPGRKGMAFHSYTGDGHQYVVPADVLGLVSAGRLDRRLFDVTELASSAYHDAGRAELPLVVTGRSASERAAVRRLAAAGARTTRELPVIDGTAVAVPKDEATGLWRSLAGELADGSIAKVWLDGIRKPSLDKSVPQIGAPAAWQDGYTGSGVKVAVLDTGADSSHPDLAGRLGETQNFTGGGGSDVTDTVGHGTHVASTIAGSGAASGGRYRGVAPDATLMIGKVCSEEGCTESAILAAMEWAAGNGAAVVNLSLGGPDTPELDPLELAVNRLTERTGTLFVISAGNAGAQGEGMVASPGSADAALTVGAVDSQDRIAAFSSRGPRVGDGAIKPDVTAPGVGIVAARAGSQPDPYVAFSGTSMAAPHVAGSVALLAQQHPDWRAGELKSVLMATARPGTGLSAYDQGAGRIDVSRAITHAVLPQPQSVALTSEPWPHHDDDPVTRTVVYRNAGSSPVTLDLAVEFRGPGGQVVPEGLIAVSPSSLTIPAGGQASAAVTADTRVSSPDGRYDGALTAVADGRSTRIPVTLDKETESYDVTFAAFDPTGQPASNASVVVQWLDQNRTTQAVVHDGVATLRLPRGRYHLGATLAPPPGPKEGGSTDPEWMAQLVKPLLTVDRDTTVTLDARTARPVRMTVPIARTVPGPTDVGYWRKRATGAWFGSQSMTSPQTEMLVRDLGPSVPRTELVSEIAGMWYEPGADGSVLNSPTLVQLAYFEPGRFFTGFISAPRRKDLAAVEADFASQRPNVFGLKRAHPQPARIAEEDGGLGFRVVAVPWMVLPHRRTEYYLADGVRWSHLLAADPAQPSYAEISRSNVVYRSGTSVSERWNVAVFGPGQPAATRTGNRLNIDLRPFSDQVESHAGYAVTDTARTTLYRNGVKIAQNQSAGELSATVPGEPAGYRLEMDATRLAPLSTRVTGVWTFRSGAGRPDRAEPVGLTTVRFAPRLDALNAAPAGRRFEIPVYVSRTEDAPHRRITSLTIEASFDGGVTWRPATVRRAGDSRWQVTVNHPSGAGHVSLRAAATDNRGDSVRQSIVRAYEYRP